MKSHQNEICWRNNRSLHTFKSIQPANLNSEGKKSGGVSVWTQHLFPFTLSGLYSRNKQRRRGTIISVWKKEIFFFLYRRYSILKKSKVGLIGQMGVKIVVIYLWNQRAQSQTHADARALKRFVKRAAARWVITRHHFPSAFFCEWSSLCMQPPRSSIHKQRSLLSPVQPVRGSHSNCAQMTANG